MADRNTKERKLIALMLNDLASSMGHDDLSQAEGEVKALSDEEIDRTLASRLDLPFPPTRRPWTPPSCTSRSRRPTRARPGTSPRPRT
jgi:hypothetical protein